MGVAQKQGVRGAIERGSSCVLFHANGAAAKKRGTTGSEVLLRPHFHADRAARKQEATRGGPAFLVPHGWGRKQGEGGAGGSVRPSSPVPSALSIHP